MQTLSDFKHLDIINRCISATLITDGWSSDIKFKLIMSDNVIALLRLSNIELYDKKKSHYKSLRPLKNKMLPISTPLDFGTCQYKNIEYCYTLFSWVEGDLAEKTLLDYSKTEQYQLGMQAGKILKEIHSIPIQKEYTSMDWFKHFNKKLDRNIKMSIECPIKYEGINDIYSYISSKRILLKSRPIVFHHGDFHIGNMLINGNQLGVIDFNRQDHGDPWEEFNRITWCSSLSPEFATGRINGYFDNKIPENFFELLALYIASNQLASVPWAIQFGQEQIDVMLGEVKNVLDSFENFNKTVPKWYLKTLY